MTEHHPDIVPTECNDVVAAITIHVTNCARVLVLAVPTVIVAKTAVRRNHRPERSVRLPERDFRIVAGKSDDIGTPVAVHVPQEAGVDLLTAPAVVIAKGVVGEEHRSESAIGLAERNVHIIAAEADDVCTSVTVHVGNMTGIDALPAPAVVLCK
ncbi:MAG TPA: hypothetical protein VED21_27825 [Azospirillum sp.]|nr:hypothetical protein [Azospirillum sp.]HYD69315.1 hypothetical protein [Azospirillum sp.]